MESRSDASALPLGKELGRTVVLAAPLALGHIATGLIGFVDSVIAGRHGTDTLAAVAVGTALFWLPLMVPLGTLMAVPAAVSKYDGEGAQEKIGPLFRQALWLATGLGACMFALLTMIPLLLPAMRIDAGIIPGASAFLHAIRWGTPAMALYLCMRYLCDGLHFTVPTMVLGFGGLLVLIPVGAVLTFGLWGVPAMGAAGLGWASAAMMWAQALVFALYLYRSKRFLPLQLFAQLEPPRWAMIAPLLATGLPIGVMVLMEGGLFVATALLMGRLGETQVAAHQIAINLSTLAFMIPFGIAEATTVRVGHAFGQKNRGAMQRAALAGLVLVLVTQFISACVLLFAAPQIVGLYTQDAAVAALAVVLLVYAAAFQFPDGVQVISAGALRGIGDTRVPMLLAAFAYWGVGFCTGAWLGLRLGYGPEGMWIGLIVGLTVAALLMSTRLWRSLRRIRL